MSEQFSVVSARQHAIGTSALTELPDVFLPYQQELWQSVDRNAVTVIEKSRRTGYSWALAAVAAAQASTARAEGGSDVLYMGYEKDMTREFVGYVADGAKAMQVAASEVEEFLFRDPERPDKDIGAFRIRFAAGYEVIALPSVPRALRGKQGLVILDEAAFMDDLDEVLKAAFALLIWGGKVVVCSTHNGDTNPFAVLVEDIRAGRKPYHLLRCTFDDAVAQGLYRRICLRQGTIWTEAGEAAWVADIRAKYGDAADEELDVIPSPSTGTYLPATLLEARATPGVPVLRWECPAGFKVESEQVRGRAALVWCQDVLLPHLLYLDRSSRHVLGEDFGRVRDLTVLWPLAITRTLARRTPFVVELRNVPFEQQKQILYYLCDRLPRFGAMKLDAGGNGAYLAEVATQRYGALVEEVQLSEPWYRENMPPLKAALEDGQLDLPADDELLGDFRMLKLVRGVARIPHARLNDERKQRHGDAAIAACLAYAASRAEPEEYDYRAVGSRQSPVAPGQAGQEEVDEIVEPRLRRRELRGSLR